MPLRPASEHRRVGGRGGERRRRARGAMVAGEGNGRRRRAEGGGARSHLLAVGGFPASCPSHHRSAVPLRFRPTPASVHQRLPAPVAHGGKAPLQESSN